MKQLIVIGSTGNNMCMIQIPTSWSLNEAKDMLEKALLEFEGNKTRGEFLSINDETELDKMYPKITSEIIECAKILLDKVGNPVNGSGGLSWQMHIQSFILKHPEFATRLIKAFAGSITPDEKAWLSAHYLDLLPVLVKALKDIM